MIERPPRGSSHRDGNISYPIPGDLRKHKRALLKRKRESNAAEVTWMNVTAQCNILSDGSKSTGVSVFATHNFSVAVQMQKNNIITLIQSRDGWGDSVGTKLKYVSNALHKQADLSKMIDGDRGLWILFKSL